MIANSHFILLISSANDDYWLLSTGYSEKKTRENLSFNFMVLPDVISLNVDLREYTNASVS